jgi:F-type H+-transporting ATPase subunit gamma
MEPADRAIKDPFEQPNGRFHRQRQSSIDEELFDVTAVYEALARP